MRHLVLDIGGVFYRGWPADDFWPLWRERTGLDRAAIEAILTEAPEHRDAQVGRITADEAFRRAGVRAGVDGAVIRAMVEDAYLSDFNERFTEAVRGLKARGVPVSALTNSLSTEAQLQARPEFRGLFDHIVSSCDVGVAKPDPAIFRALTDRLGVAPAEVVFVDDLAGHVDAARALGLHAIHFRETAQALVEIAAYFPATSESSRL